MERRPAPMARLAESETDREAVYQIRCTVFQIEQAVPTEIERDAYDETAAHFLATDPATGDVIGAARLVDKGEGVAKIGRVAVLPEWRGTGAGRELMAAVLTYARAAGFALAMLDAQTPVIGFYERLGFVAEGPEFIEADIPHRRMTLRL